MTNQEKAKQLKKSIDATHDLAHTGEIDKACIEANRGGKIVAQVKKAQGEKAALALVKTVAGDRPDAEQIAKDVVEAVVTPRVPPHPFFTALFARLHTEREELGRDALCSIESSVWIDGTSGKKGAKQDLTSTKTLLNRAIEEADPIKCFLLALRVTGRSIRSEFILRLYLYLCSKAFESDRKAFFEGGTIERGRERDVKLMFNGLRKIVSGLASEADCEGFVDALSRRIEDSQHLKPGGAWETALAGFDALAEGIPVNGERVIIAGLTSANTDARKSFQNASTLRENYDALRQDGARIVLVLGGSPIIEAEGRMSKAENKKLSGIRADVAVLQAMESVFRSGNPNIIEDVLAGKTEIQVVYGSTERPLILRADNLFAATEKAIEAALNAGKMPETKRGLNAWQSIAGTMASWARFWPETFPRQSCDKWLDWIGTCPSTEKPEIEDAKFNAESSLELSPERAIETALKAREEFRAKAKKPRKKSAMTEMIEGTIETLQDLSDELLGPDGPYKEGSTDYRSMQAMVRDKDLEGLRRVQKGERPRMVRNERRKMRG